MIKKIVIATHVFAPGPSQALRDYLIKEKKEVLFIGHPILGNLFTWLLGALDTFFKVLKQRKKYDLYVGYDNVNAFIGLILKKMGKVEKVIFMTVDYSHNRFKNKMLNNFYHWLDYYCLKNANLVWNSTDRMVFEREKRGILKIYRNKQIAVPDGTDLVKLVPFDKRNLYEIVFVGHLKEDMGLELLIESFPEIEKEIPEVKLTIIGSGYMEKKLKEQARGLNIEFKGFIGDLTEVYKIITKAVIGLAIYNKNGMMEFTDPAKVKLYLSAGLPVIVTRVPQIATEIENKKCGITIDYNKEELKNAIVRLLKNQELLKKYSDNALILSKKYLWSNIFREALGKLYE